MLWFFFLLILIVLSIMLVVFYNYIIIVLVIIELVVFNITLIVGIVLLSMELDFYLRYYLVCSLCESGVGISMLVLIVRYYGNDIYYFIK